MTFRYCISRVTGRGAGLGNELVPWARAYLMAQVCGAHLLPPAFGLNARAYYRHFGTSRADWLVQRAMMLVMPVTYFGEADYHAHGAGDVRVAFKRFVDARKLADRQPIIFATDGLWGGLDHIAAAREFARATLAGSRHAVSNMAALGLALDPTKITVAMHIRLGDFQGASRLDDYRGVFNRAMPLEWFIEGGLQLRRVLGDGVQFLLSSDGTPAQLAPLVHALQPVRYEAPAPADCSDLLALASADLLFCSISSYSAWAAFLSTGYYVWFQPQLQPMAGGLMSIWGHEPVQQAAGSPTLSAASERLAESADKKNGGADGRALALAPGGQLPERVVEDLCQRLALRRRGADLVRYGVVRNPLVSAEGQGSA